MTSPRISIVIPAFNAANSLAETLDSVLAQTDPDFEVVVVDDGSSDGTLEIARRYNEIDPRIRVVTKANGGTGSAYNAGVKAASGDWLVLLSADDLLEPGHIEVFRSVLSGYPEGVGLASSDGTFLYENGRAERAYVMPAYGGKSSFALVDLFGRCYFAVGSAFSRAAWVKVGGFDEDIYGEDYLFFMRVLAAGFTHVFIDRPLAIHRRHGAQKSADTRRVAESDIKILNRVRTQIPLDDSALLALAAALERRRYLLRVASHQLSLAEWVHEYAVRSMIALLGRERTEMLVNRLKGRTVR